ncbi:MAG: hypothetical protein WCQ21_30385, partial [Verrucomicrobiota bacterium]
MLEGAINRRWKPRVTRPAHRLKYFANTALEKDSCLIFSAVAELVSDQLLPLRNEDRAEQLRINVLKGAVETLKISNYPT